LPTYLLDLGLVCMHLSKGPRVRLGVWTRWVGGWVGGGVP
jgi:hypothetical protein